MTEKDIISGCQRGEARCQQALVTRFAPLLMSVARRYMGSSTAAKDVLQDALIKVFNNIRQYQPTGSFEAWMRRIVVNTALQALDKNWLRNIQSVDIYPVEPYAEPEILDQLNIETLFKLIESLPEGGRQVFNLYIIEKYSHKEISEMLSISQENSRLQLHRARLILQQMILQLEKIQI